MTTGSIQPPPQATFRRAVLGWYDREGRTLPFRGTTDPWAVLVSEVMAQQTQISRVGPAWLAFMARFPGPEALAAASPADVLRAWAGLGYNRRALALRRCAQVVVEEHGGRLPDSVTALERLPGIGPYTARAVVAIAFGRAAAAVDTNVRRVLGRVAGGADGPTSMSPAAMQALADGLVPADRPADWTHALMDVGSVFCRPRSPRCGECPARRWCRAAASGPEAVSRRSARPVSGRLEWRFEGTSRWLRGRLLATLRSAEEGAWVRFEGAVGSHDPVAVAEALDSLAREGFLERRPGDGASVRLRPT